MDISVKNQQINKLQLGQLIRLENQIFRFMGISKYNSRSSPTHFLCEDVFTKKHTNIDIWDMRHACEFITEDSPAYRSISVLYGTKDSRNDVNGT